MNNGTVNKISQFCKLNSYWKVLIRYRITLYFSFGFYSSDLTFDVKLSIEYNIFDIAYCRFLQIPMAVAT